MQKIPATVITGFLGAGKTTMIRNMLMNADGRKIALIINEYALIVGLITLNDVTATLVGATLDASDEAQIIRRDDNSWLVDGLTPVGDLEALLGVPPFPDDDQFETIAGFLMYVLRKVPRPTERVDHGGFRFEVLDVDHHRIDQLLVTRLDPEAP